MKKQLLSLKALLTATLMDKETKEPLQADGKPITATTTFTPEDACKCILFSWN
jgi:hypothetical protein